MKSRLESDANTKRVFFDETKSLNVSWSWAWSWIHNSWLLFTGDEVLIFETALELQKYVSSEYGTDLTMEQIMWGKV